MEHISSGVAKNLREWLVRTSILSDVGKARGSLSESIARPVSERRLASRSEVPERRGRGRVSGGTLMNLSRRGLAVKIPSERAFARGQSYRLGLRAGSGTVEIEGTVRWTRSLPEGTEEATPKPGSRYLQLAGFSLPEELPPESEAILGILRGLVRDIGVTVQVESVEALQSRGDESPTEALH